MKVELSTLTGSFIMTLLVLGIVFNQQGTSDSQKPLRELTFTQMSAMTGGACNLPQEAQPSDKWQPEVDCPLQESLFPKENCDTDGIWWNEDWACNGASYQSSSECIEVDAGVVEYVYHACEVGTVGTIRGTVYFCEVNEYDSSSNASDFEYQQNNSCI